MSLGEEPLSARGHPLTGKTGRALVVMVGLLALPYASPRLKALRVARMPWEPEPVAAEPEPVVAPEPPPPPATAGEQALPASENFATVNNALPAESHAALPDLDPAIRAALHGVGIEDPTGHALDAFFAHLARTDHQDPGAVTRVLHYGDSTIASDFISGTVRRRLQARFGDSGHGFILIANPWQWYFHNDVFHVSDGGWSASKLGGPLTPDNLYGLGGVSFTCYGGCSSTFGTAPSGDYGRNVSRYDLYYLEQPGGGNVEITAHGTTLEKFSTRGKAKVSRVRAIHVPDGESKIAVRATGGGQTRLFGIALERDRPGVVYDSLGAHAAIAVNWFRQDRKHWKDQLDLRDPALVVFQYGTNESENTRIDLDAYERALGDLLEEVKASAPAASVLVVSPLDRADWQGGKMPTKPVILDLVAIQHRVALAHGVAFWNTFEAMGGQGSMGRWVRTKPQLGGPDLTHPTPRGAEVIGDLLSDALINGYERYAASLAKR
ncbi:MAG TPA: GDSL-type esterase/lipase family protein [Polyangiaceae bacterium]|nr:GDSL-type esterase/lipase family protein [Polyangiaceae bacterium]